MQKHTLLSDWTAGLLAFCGCVRYPKLLKFSSESGLTEPHFIWGSRGRAVECGGRWELWGSSRVMGVCGTEAPVLGSRVPRAPWADRWGA